MSSSGDPVVTVVIPFFNMGQFIRETITSLREQTYRDFEVIVVNDGSTDSHSLEVLRDLETDGFRVINQYNKGLSGARNTGIKNAKGTYIACIDPDDLYEPTFLEESVGVLDADKNQEFAVVNTHLRCFGCVEFAWQTGGYDPALLLWKNQLHCACLYRKEAWEKVGGYDESMVGGYEDWDFWISLAEAGYKWTVLERPLFKYRVRTDSISSSARKNHAALFAKIMSNHPALYKKHYDQVIHAQSQEIKDLERLIFSAGIRFEQIKDTQIWKFLTSR